MGKKRRNDEDFTIGESAPGTTGDSDGTDHDGPKSPMAIIHDRREGELLSAAEVEEFLNPTDPSEIHPHHEPKEISSESYDGDDLADEDIEKIKTVKKYEGRYSDYWPDEAKGSESET